MLADSVPPCAVLLPFSEALIIPIQYASWRLITLYSRYALMRLAFVWRIPRAWRNLFLVRMGWLQHGCPRSLRRHRALYISAATYRFHMLLAPKSMTVPCMYWLRVPLLEVTEDACEGSAVDRLQRC